MQQTPFLTTPLRSAWCLSIPSSHHSQYPILLLQWLEHSLFRFPPCSIESKNYPELKHGALKVNRDFWFHNLKFQNWRIIPITGSQKLGPKTSPLSPPTQATNCSLHVWKLAQSASSMQSLTEIIKENYENDILIRYIITI